MNNQQSNQVSGIQVRIHKTFDDPEDKIQATASVTIDGAFAVHGFKVWDIGKGPFVSMPSIRVGDEYRETFHPITREAREQLTEAVLDAYQAKLEETQNQDAVQYQAENTPVQSM